LHLIEPLGFSLEDRYLRRAGLDYWPYLELKTHPSWRDYDDSAPAATRVHFSAHAHATFLDAPLADDRLELVFGCETKGLPTEVARDAGDRIYRIPISQPAVRSLNLANAVAIVLYEALRRRQQLL